MQMFFSFLFCLVMVPMALARPNIGSRSQSDILVPPPPKEGESADQYLAQLFGPLDGPPSNITSTTNASISARSLRHVPRDSPSLGTYREISGIHELTWTNQSGRMSYNLSIDLSRSCTGLNLTSEIGVYTFTNGTTTSNTVLGDIIGDVWSLKPTPNDHRRRWANHTETLAQLALEEADSTLNSGLICENYTATKVLMHAASSNPDMNPVHDELRHLLSSAWSYWTATIVSSIFGAALGASFAGGIQHYFSGNVTAQNVVQTAAVVGATVLIGGILMRLHENGRIDRIAEVANERAQMGRQAVLQNAHIARWREAFQEIRRLSTERARDGADTNRDLGGFSVDGQTSPGSVAQASRPETPGRSSGQFACLSSREAVHALRALGGMTSDDINLRVMEAIEDIELERMENGDMARVDVASAPDSRRPSSLPSTPRAGFFDWSFCRVPDSSRVSFKTAKSKGGAGEASAQDLVEMGNMPYSKQASESEPSSSDGSRGGAIGPSYYTDFYGGGGGGGGNPDGSDGDGGVAGGGGQGGGGGGVAVGANDKGKQLANGNG